MTDLQRKYADAYHAWKKTGMRPGPLQDTCQNAEWELYKAEGGPAVMLARTEAA